MLGHPYLRPTFPRGNNISREGEKAITAILRKREKGSRTTEGEERAGYNITSERRTGHKTIQDSLSSRRCLRTTELLAFVADGNTYACNSWALPLRR